MEDGNLFGFLNVYKPVGMTSHDVVSVLRRVTKIKQIGHTGTLDPFAEGVLPIAIGKATRLIEYLDDDKAYVGRFCFGKSTDTYDIEGKIINVFDDKVSEGDVIKHIPIGEIEQVPPIYSAKKVNGKKLYEYARNDENVEIKPQKINIYESKLIEFNENEQWADIYIKCSKGTYIRSIANDLGKALNNGCYLSKLKRVQAGMFVVDNTTNLDDIKTIQDAKKNILNPTEYLSQPTQDLNDIEYERISHGMPIYNRINASDGTVMLLKDRTLIAISEVAESELKPRKVLL